MALITEISTTIQKEDLNGYLSSKKYKVVTNANSIFLKNKNTNFIFVLTPERLLYLLMSYQDLSIDYLFVDEAHKISKRDDRSTFYYKVFDMLMKRNRNLMSFLLLLIFQIRTYFLTLFQMMEK